MTLLPESFQPGENDVICGRGKKCYNHVGNERFRVRVSKMLDEYSKAKSKLDKSGVLASVVDQIRALSPDGGFVKQNEEGRWFEVGDFLAREKTSQAFRDALHERYKSSNVAKKKKRQEEQQRAHDHFQRSIARSYSDIPVGRLDWLGISASDMQRGDIAPMAGHPHHMQQPGAYDIYRGNSYGAAMRLSRLTEMQQRLNRRFPGQEHQHQPPQGQYQRSGSLPMGGNGVGDGGSNSTMGIRFPDPLFGQRQGNQHMPGGTMSSGSNAYGVAPNKGIMMERSNEYATRQAYSMPPSPTPDPDELLAQIEEIDIQDLARPSPRDLAYEQATQQEALHHSMPNIHISSGYDPYDLSVERSMHHSAPDVMYSEESGGLIDESIHSDIDPIPLDEITPRPAAKKSVPGDEVKKVISMTLSPTSPSAEVVSRDLLACLEKLNGSTIKDDNPFEPLPLNEEAATGADSEGEEEPLDAYRARREQLAASPFE